MSDTVSRISGYEIEDEKAREEIEKIKKIDTYINVKDYGAKGDGTTNDSESIQQAISENPGKTIYIPEGTYIIDSPINIMNASTKILGAGNKNTTIKKTTLTTNNIQIDNNGETYDFNKPSIFNLIFPENQNISYINISDLELIGTTEIYGILAPHCSYSNFKNIRFNTLKYGIITGGWVNRIDNCLFFDCVTPSEIYSGINIIVVNSTSNNGCFQVYKSSAISYNSVHVDNGNPCFIASDSEVSYVNCSTETLYKMFDFLESRITIAGGDFEGHTSATANNIWKCFITAKNSQLNVNGGTYRFENYNEVELPSNHNFTENNNSRIKIDCILITPYETTNYISGSNAVTEINGEVLSKVAKTLNRKFIEKTADAKVELIRLPFSYGVNYGIFIKGYGTYSHTAVSYEGIISAICNGTSNASGSTIKPNIKTSVASQNTPSMTIEITAEVDLTSQELVIYYNSSNGYPIPLKTIIEYA